jgi:integrase
MTKLESTIDTVMRRLKSELAAETWESRRRYYNQMIGLAKSLGINEPCQNLYDAYVADDHGSEERHRLHIRCVKLLDAASGTEAKDENGRLYNELPMPSIAETQEYFQDREYPSLKRIGIDHLIVKATMEMQHLNLTNSTTGQYRHAWMDIRRYFHEHSHFEYNELLLRHFIRKIGVDRGDGSMMEWKCKINRKAALVLIEVANTGRFNWAVAGENTICTCPEIEPIRNHYLLTQTNRNLSKSTVGLHNYVFRKAIAFLGIETADDLRLMSPDSVRHVTVDFAGICNRRSMATLLPILRSLLKFLYESGYVGKNLSGLVMSGYMQKGSVAGYMSAKDQNLLLTHLDQEPKRTKAIIFLAIKLGLRDSDICNLRFQEIDWQNDRIRLLQEKTGNPLVLPLLPDVGNALMDYILHERPKRNDRYPYVFLRQQAPYKRITTVYHICSKLITKLGITPVNGKSKGVHVYRYTMVHKLLEAKTPHQVITDVLGHVSKESDKPYISMEESMLRVCALDLSVIGKISWEGGVKND